MPLISVIVPVYNAESYIHRCLESILAQTFSDFELILVDDGSPDDCGRICDEYAAKDNRIKVIHQMNSGVSAARNAGIEIACGEFLTFVDSDDYIAEDFFADAVHAIEKEKVDLYLAGLAQVESQKVLRHTVISSDCCMPIQELDEQQMIDMLVNCYTSSSCGKLISRELIGATRFDCSMNFGEDLKFVHEIIQKRGFMLAKAKSSYFYTVEYRNDNNLTATMNDKKCISIVKTYRILLDFAQKWGKESQYYKTVAERWINDYTYVEQMILYSAESIARRRKMLCLLQSDSELKQILVENVDKNKRICLTFPLLLLLREKAWQIKMYNYESMRSSNMIPKIIHYCWFGGNPKPKQAQNCIKSWKKHCHGYKIIEWSEENYDLRKAPLYVRQAYEAKKWAFVTDYVRLQVVYENGGIYMDTDVELLKPLDSLLSYNAYFGFEDGKYVATGLGFGAVSGLSLIREMMEDYQDIPFIMEDGTLDLTPCPVRNVSAFVCRGMRQDNSMQILDGNIAILPWEYFSPIGNGSDNMGVTENTVSIHWFSGSWCSEQEQKEREEYYLWMKRKGILEFLSRTGKRLLGEYFYTKIRDLIKR